MNILVVKPSSLGDVIHALPAAHLLRQHFPDAHISWVVNNTYAGIVELCPAVDDVIPFRRKRLGQMRHWHEILAFVRELRQRRYDIAFDLQGLLRSGLIARASGASRRIGFRNAREGAHWFYTEKVPLPANLKHAVDKNVFMVRSVLGATAPTSFPDLTIQHDFLKCARRLLRSADLEGDGPLLAVAPVARWHAKTWPPTFFARVLDMVVAAIPETRCWLLGTQDEAPAADAVTAACQRCQPCNLCGETNLGTLVEMVRLTDALLTNDTGPMHLAAALGVPTVALFGPTDPGLTGPYGPAHAVFTGTCETGPCFSRRCPRDVQQCLDAISPAEVADAVIHRLRSRSSPSVGGRLPSVVKEEVD